MVLFAYFSTGRQCMHSAIITLPSIAIKAHLVMTEAVLITTIATYPHVCVLPVSTIFAAITL